jgi:hypothetical protein
LITSEEGFLGREDVPDEDLVGLLAVFACEVAEEDVVVEIVQFV